MECLRLGLYLFPIQNQTDHDDDDGGYGWYRCPDSKPYERYFFSPWKFDNLMRRAAASTRWTSKNSLSCLVMYGCILTRNRNYSINEGEPSIHGSISMYYIFCLYSYLRDLRVQNAMIYMRRIASYYAAFRRDWILPPPNLSHFGMLGITLNE